MSLMRLQLLLSATLAMSAHSALAQGADGEDANLDCPAEVAAFLAAVRADDAYPQIAQTFADREARLDAAMRADGADCLIVLRDAQRSLVDANVVVAGASDAAAVERVTRLIDGGSPTDGGTAPTMRTVEIAPSTPPTQDAPEMRVIEVEPTAPNADGGVAAVPDAAAPREAGQPTNVATTAAASDDGGGVEALAVREVEFGFDSAAVPDDARTGVLAEVAAAVEANAEASVLLTGYASPIGNAEYNLRLSERRVAAVAAMLKEMGVPEAAIRTRARGEQDPEVPAGEDELSEENRRVEIQVVPGGVPDRG